MTRNPDGRRIVLPAVFAGLSCIFLSCSAFRPEGDGGWSEARRAEEVARAAQLSDQTAASANATGDEASSIEDAEPRTLDLATALELAARRNRNIRAAEEVVAVAAGEVAATRSALLPQTTVRGGYSWYEDEQSTTVAFDPTIFGLPPLDPGTPLPQVSVREQDFATVNAAMRLALDLSGEYRHALTASQAAYRAEQARAWATRLQEEREVTAAYFGVLEARALRSVAGQTVALHERQLADAQSRFDEGRLTRNEVLVVDVTLANSRQLLVRLDNAIAAQRRALNRATGLAVDAPTEVRDVAARPLLPSLEDTVAIARTKNPLVVASLEEAQAVEERVTAAKRSRFPRFAVQGNYDATTSQIVEPNNYASVNAVVDVDLYSFRREAEIDKLEAASRRTRLLLDRSVRDVEALVRDSHDRLRERLTAIDVAAAAARQADENLRIRQAQFDEGRATSEDLLDASELAARQKGNLATALYEAHLRRAELQQLLGEPLGEITNASVVLPQDARQPLPLPRENRPLTIDPIIDPSVDQGDAPR